MHKIPASPSNSLLYTPVVFESLGAVGSLSHAILRDIGRQIRLVSGETKASFFLLQRLSVAVQKGNCALICS